MILLVHLIESKKKNIPNVDKNSKLKTINTKSSASNFNNLIDFNLKQKLTQLTNQNSSIVQRENASKFLENKILNSKYKEIKQKNRLSTDFNNTTAIKNKLQNEYISTVSTNLKTNGQTQLNTPSLSIISKEKNVTNLHRNNKDKLNTINTESKTHRQTESMPRLTNNITNTNNIFYIINQNPQINTHITIYNNIEDNKGTISKNKMPKMINNNVEVLTSRLKSPLNIVNKVIRNSTSNLTERTVSKQ